MSNFTQVPDGAPKDVPYYSQIHGLAKGGFAKKVLQHRALTDEAKQIDEQRRQLATEIGEALDRAGAKSVGVDIYKVTRAAGRKNKKLDPNLLLAKGVKASIIEECTVTTEGQPYVLITDTAEAKARGKGDD